MIDALRGFALLGILMSHLEDSYYAAARPAAWQTFNILAPVDEVVSEATLIFTFGKFFTIFSFLFGLSFAIQLQRTNEQSNPFTRRFLWRMVMLLGIGYLHHLHYSGDVLITYALLGLLLLLCRNWTDKKLLLWAIVLLLNLPSVLPRVMQLALPVLPAHVQQGQQAFFEQFEAQNLQNFTIKQTGSYADVLQLNARKGLLDKLLFQFISGRLYVTFGLFLLGLYAGRKRLFQDTPAQQQFFRKLLCWSGLVAVPATLWVALFYEFHVFDASFTGWEFIGTTALDISNLSLSAVYVSAVVLLYRRTSWQQALRWLLPVGRMGLTTYLMQSAVGVWLFYGFSLGMIGKLGVTASILIGMAFFTLQILFSRWWLSKYQYGPAEWLWRSLTYFKIQPIERKPSPAGKYRPVAHPFSIK